MKTTFKILLIVCALYAQISPAYAIVDPRLSPNNKVGINSLSPDSETADIKELVNTNGDWGYALIVIKKSERDLARWQKVMDSFNQNHIIPIVRIATEVDASGVWQRPTDDDAKAWAQFLNSLYWPTKNRYVQIYNEVNRAKEWGGAVDAANYAAELDKTIGELKAKSDDFFTLNAPLDLALATSSDSLESFIYIQTMADSQTGIFEKLDGWASHSYPNPDFSSSPAETGKTSVHGYIWEQAVLELYTDKNLPVFITETGWRVEPLTETTIAANYTEAYDNAWSDVNVVAVTPFLLSYIDPLFANFSYIDHSSPKRPREFFYEVKNMDKAQGNPQRDEKSELVSLKNPDRVINKSPARIYLKVKNVGNYIWSKDSIDLSIDNPNIQWEVIGQTEQTLPGQVYEAEIKINSQAEGQLDYKIELKNSDRTVLSTDLQVESVAYVDFVLDLLKSAIG